MMGWLRLCHIGLSSDKWSLELDSNQHCLAVALNLVLKLNLDCSDLSIALIEEIRQERCADLLRRRVRCVRGLDSDFHRLLQCMNPRQRVDPILCGDSA